MRSPVCILGPDAVSTITVDGRDYDYEWHHYMGPVVIGKRGRLQGTGAVLSVGALTGKSAAAPK